MVDIRIDKHPHSHCAVYDACTVVPLTTRSIPWYTQITLNSVGAQCPVRGLVMIIFIDIGCLRVTL